MFRRNHAEDFFGARLAARDFKHRGLAELGHLVCNRFGADVVRGAPLLIRSRMSLLIGITSKTPERDE